MLRCLLPVNFLRARCGLGKSDVRIILGDIYGVFQRNDQVRTK